MDYNKYIGLPYQENGRNEQGIDCWGLARLFYKNELNIELPSYTELYDGSYDPKAVAAINYYKDTWTKVYSPQMGDLCLFKIMGELSHVGVYIDSGKFLHSRDGKDSVIESINSPMWFNRLEGFYRYTETSPLTVIGSPHPLQWNQAVELAQPGTNCQAFANYISTKYNLSAGFSKQLILTIDGVPVPRDRWETTYFEKGQIVNYKIVAQGRQGLRTVASIAIIIAATALGGPLGAAIEFAGADAAALGQLGINTTVASAGFKIAGTLAIQFAGMALVNAAFPIRPPKDPGQAIPTNMFSGTQNQANPFGAIPVVLGKTRVTGLLGATPYLETLTATSLLHLIIIWGFGPLWVDEAGICVGATKLSSLHQDTTKRDRKVQLTLSGSDLETDSEREAFNNYYPSDVQQLPTSPVELINNSTTGNPWTTVTFTQAATNIKVAINFPEGLRMINTESGNSYAHKVRFAIACYPSSYGDPGNTVDIPANQNELRYSITTNKTFGLQAPGSLSIPLGDNGPKSWSLYRKYIFAIQANGSVEMFAGSVSDNNGSIIDQDLINALESTGYASLLGLQDTYQYTPTIPSGFIKLHEVVLGPNNYYTTNSFLSGYSSYVITGLTLTSTADTISGELTGGRTVTIASGSIKTNTINTPTTEIDTLIFSAYTDLPNAVAVTQSTWANEFLRTNAVWSSTNAQTHEYDDQATGVVFPYDGYYTIDLAADNWAETYVNGIQVASTSNSFKNDEQGGVPAGSVRQQVYITAGTYTVRVVGKNRTGDGTNPGLTNSNRGVACRIRFVWDGVDNINPNQGWEIVELEKNEKDGFNFIYEFPDRPRNTYTVRVKRLTADNTSSGKTQFAHKAYLYAITATDTSVAPLKPLPVRGTEKRNLARTAIVVQSTNKVNGTLEGVNALVQTKAKVWTGTKWEREQPTSNPASLFAYVLQHTANAYPVSDSEIDWDTLKNWYIFCDLITTTKPKFEYNNVLNSTQSLMEVLKDIAAAGMASPTFINGKWSVVIDKPRDYIVQHFTPHNSWGFSSTKSLVFIPDAFRVSFPNELKAYQPDELIVYNYGYAETAGFIVNANSFVTGNTYKITFLGTTNWNAIGYSGAPMVGETFVKNSTTATGTGRAFSTQSHTTGTFRAVSAAEKFEQISLPGVTNPDQVRYFARWHLAQLKLRPEVYTINADFEYLVCTRGDLVKVTHDVPLWGAGSARIKSIVGTTITLTEPVLLNNTKSYSVLIRTNAKDGQNNSIVSISRTIQSVATSNYYNTITVTDGNLAGAEVDNLIMIGETGKVTQDLVVLSIQPSGNTSATLTLTDYSPEIYTKDLDDESISFNANISLENIDIVKTTITQAPKIIEVATSSGLSEQVSTGTFINTTVVTFNNPSNLTQTATTIEVEIAAADNIFDPDRPKNPYYTDKQSSSLALQGLTTDALYKLRARYTNNEHSVFGPWSSEYGFQVVGKSNNPFVPNDVMITLQGTNIIVKPILNTGNSEPSDHKTYEFRLYRSTGTGDFWTATWDSANMLKAQSRTQAVFNLLDLPSTSGNRRISQTGINYRVACRALNNTNSYSSTSVLGSILIKTIQ
jgi:hypothetical protein